MLILSIDTSGVAGGVALTRGNEIVAERALNARRTHARRLIPTIRSVLKECEIALDQLDAFALTKGPGSFTGIRIGMSAMKGLAYALNKPLVGVSTLAALASNLPYCRYQICPLLDAKKRMVFFGVYEPLDGRFQLKLKEQALRPEEMIPHITEPTVFLGDGARVYGDLLRERLGRKAIIAPRIHHQVRAAQVGALAFQRLEAGRPDDAFTLEPSYLRQSDAEISLRERLGQSG